MSQEICYVLEKIPLGWWIFKKKKSSEWKKWKHQYATETQGPSESVSRETSMSIALVCVRETCNHQGSDRKVMQAPNTN